MVPGPGYADAAAGWSTARSSGHTLCKGLFPCVHPAVLLQAAAVYKALATVKAYKRPLLSVCELVAQQVRAVTEAVATLAAHEWSLTCVDLLMPQQVAALAEHFATHHNSCLELPQI